MDSAADSLEIPVTYKGQELIFSAKFLMSGYTHKIQVEVDNQLIVFEPDEESNYRAVLAENQLDKSYQIDLNLLQAIAQVIESVIRK